MKNTVSPNKSWLPYAALTFSVVALAFSSVFVLWAKAPGAMTAFYREAIAAVLTVIPFYFMTKKERPFPRKYAMYAVIAGVFFAADIAVWNVSVFMTSATNATLFNNTSVLWIGLVAALFFKEKLTYVFGCGLLLALIGIVTIVGADYIHHPTLGAGDFLAMLAALGYAGFFLAMQKSRVKLGVLSSFWFSAAAGAVFLLPICLVLGQPFSGYSSTTYWSFLGMAVVTQIGGYTGINYALGHLPATLVSIIVLMQPAVTAILAALLVDQPIELNQVLGGMFILSGIIIASRSRSRTQQQEAAVQLKQEECAN
jgi:drug/metabolite transporter (DMT)-like permease